MKLFNRNKTKKDDEDEKKTAEEVKTPISPSGLAEEKPVEEGEAKVVLPEGKDAAAYGLIRSPYITEKSTMLNQINQYVFKIYKSTNKIQVKKAIESLYDVKVTGVRIINLPSKTRRLGKQTGQRSGFKKAIVSLTEGDKIEVT